MILVHLFEFILILYDLIHSDAPPASAAHRPANWPANQLRTGVFHIGISSDSYI